MSIANILRILVERHDADIKRIEESHEEDMSLIQASIDLLEERVHDIESDAQSDPPLTTSPAFKPHLIPAGAGIGSVAFHIGGDGKNGWTPQWATEQPPSTDASYLTLNPHTMQPFKNWGEQWVCTALHRGLEADHTYTILRYPGGATPGSGIHDSLNHWWTMEDWQREAIERVVPPFLKANPEHRIILYMSIAFDGVSNNTLSPYGHDGKVLRVDVDNEDHRLILNDTVEHWHYICGDQLLICFDGTSNVEFGGQEAFFKLQKYLASEYQITACMEAWPIGATNAVSSDIAREIDCFAYTSHLRPSKKNNAGELTWPDFSQDSRLHLIFHRAADTEEDMQNAHWQGVNICEGFYKHRKLLRQIREGE